MSSPVVGWFERVAADLALEGIGMARFSTRQWCVRHLRLVVIVRCPSRSGRDMLNESALS